MGVHVGRVDGKAIEVRSKGDAEQIISIISLLDPEGVAQGKYYIDAPEVQEAARFWIIDNVRGDDLALPEPASTRGGEGPYVWPIVDDEYGGVIAWANEYKQAERLVGTLTALTAVMEWLRTAQVEVPMELHALLRASVPDEVYRDVDTDEEGPNA